MILIVTCRDGDPATARVEVRRVWLGHDRGLYAEIGSGLDRTIVSWSADRVVEWEAEDSSSKEERE